MRGGGTRMMDATRGWASCSSGYVSGTISTSACSGIRPWVGGELDLNSSCTSADDPPAGTTCGVKPSGRQDGGGGSRRGHRGFVAGAGGLVRERVASHRAGALTHLF
ncbi:hypothetical protein ZWY2020_052400 [Hordeum vulgare]|nr:hypothetical protein ZWY2020_052400 [Hordeum vulgare]